MWENLKLRILKKTTLIFLWLCIATLQEQHHRLGNDFDFEYQLCSHSHQNRNRENYKWIFIAGLQLYMSRLGEAEENGMVWGMGTSGTSVVVWALAQQCGHQYGHCLLFFLGLNYSWNHKSTEKTVAKYHRRDYFLITLVPPKNVLDGKLGKVSKRFFAQEQLWNPGQLLHGSHLCTPSATSLKFIELKCDLNIFFNDF